MEKAKDIFQIELYGVQTEVKLEFDSYENNGTLALQLFCKPDVDEMPTVGSLDDPYQSLYGIVTVNLLESEMLDDDEQFVDENNMPGIGRWLQDNGIAKPSGKAGFCGFCSYMSYKFEVSADKLAEIRNRRRA